MEKLISFIKGEFPKDALDIQECIDLLNQCLDGSVESFKKSFTNAIDIRDYEKLSIMQEMLQSVGVIQTKLDEYSNLLQLDENIEEEIILNENLNDDTKEIPNYESYRIDQNIPYNLYTDYTHKRPSGFEILGVRHDAKDWKEMFVKTCEVLAEKNLSLFNSFVQDKSMQGRKVAYFCKDQKSIRAPRKIKGTDIYIMTNMSANQTRNVIEMMLRKYNIKINDYKIYLKADYTALHD